MSRWKPPLLPSLSTTSFTSSRRSFDFSDISAAGEMQRFENDQMRAIKQSVIRKERLGAIHATKNSLLMLLLFLILTMPIIISAIPEVISQLKSLSASSTVLILANLVYFANAAVFPVWYLIGSAHVRACVLNLYENIVIRMKIRA